ncbi:MAG TPA: twin-arginine translocase TatA/TatE family subunit [Candidatus Saccharimonadales bacterium]|jgi:sec-independent protein translocase protein TatA|nr:twin-arginine translocase TatA/TatE family subunit [Candidatus Saccharimonadales bacterium]
MLGHFAFLDLDTPDLIIILAIVLLLFGGRKLPQLSKSLADSVRELRKGFGGDNVEEDEKNTKKKAPPEKDSDSK